VTIADEVRKHHEPALVKLARRALRGPVSEVEIAAALGINAPSPLTKSARAIVAAGDRIRGVADAKRQGRLRGAVLERLVHDLVKEREPSLQREVEVAIDPNGHSKKAWTDPKEIAVDADPFEAYECKVSPGWLNQADVDKMCDVADAADAAGVDSRPTIAVLSTAKDVQAQRAGLSIWRPLFVADIEDLVDLSFRPATRKLV
jgi:hypothetical protein